MAYKIFSRKPRPSKSYIVFDSYQNKEVAVFKDREEASRFMEYHKFRGDTSLRMKEENR